MKVISFSKCSKFYVDFENATKPAEDSSMIVEVIGSNFRLLFFFIRKFYKHRKYKM